MKKVLYILSVVLLVFLAMPKCWATVSCARYVGTYIPKVRMIAPAGDIVDLSGKKSLDFKWSPHEGRRFGRKYYDFRIYEGTQALGPYLVYKDRVSPEDWTLSLDSGMFKDGGVYTWTMRQVYRSRGKSNRSYSTFKVINKVNGGA